VVPAAPAARDRAAVAARSDVIDRSEFLPSPDLDTDEMRRLQRALADAAAFEDDHDLAADRIALQEPLSIDDAPGRHQCSPVESARTVVGVDVAFRDDRAAAAAVAIADGRVLAVGEAVVDLAVPYVPGLLAFREGTAVLAALSELAAAPDLLVVDGSGRVHYRAAGLATHLGVVVDRPAVGVAKSLLCGRPRRPVESGLPEGERVPIEANDRFEHGAETGEVVGYAVSTRQYDSPDRHVNPLYVSPGHRVSAATAADLVLALAAGYKLPEPTRLADRYLKIRR